ncbi:MAG: sulfatase [Chitinophagaceae bacterium]|nr:sulfatase [Chitinophagaceae bacterium]
MLKIFIPFFLVLLNMGHLNAQQTKSPNIILFLIDDMGWMDSSVPFGDSVGLLNKQFKTPNLALLAKQGVKFTNAYSNSVCTPTRTSILTGMNVTHHGVTNWTSPVKNNTTDAKDAQFNPAPWKINGVEINSITTYPQILKQAGYYTIHVGKAHWGSAGTPMSNPLNLGFMVNIAGHAAGHPQSYYGKDNYGNIPGKSTYQSVPDLMNYHGSDTNLTEALTLEAIKSLEEPIRLKMPFYLNMAHYAVHVPIQPDVQFYQSYLEEGLDTANAKYASMVASIDKSLGDIMKFLSAKDIANNTIIIFMSDNGGLSLGGARGEIAHVQNLPLRAGKGSMYEGGIRVPMIVKWPEVVKSNSTINQYVIAEDFFPSILAMAGVQNFKTIQKVDGKSFVPLLKNNKITDTNRILVWHYPNKWMNLDGPAINYKSAIRQGKWKLIYDLRNGHKELYNLSNDLGEHIDLSLQQPAKTKQLSILLKDILEKNNAPMPSYKINSKKVEILID